MRSVPYQSFDAWIFHVWQMCTPTYESAVMLPLARIDGRPRRTYPRAESQYQLLGRGGETFTPANASSCLGRALLYEAFCNGHLLVISAY